MEIREEQLALLRSEARRKYQVMIDYIKDQVGEGSEYLNDLVRVVVSEKGCYYEFREMPEEFSGAVGSGFQHEFIGSSEALDLLAEIQRLVELSDEFNTRELALLVVYSREGLYNRDETYIYHNGIDGEPDEYIEPITSGQLRPGVVPLFFKIKVDSDLAVPLLGARRGVLFFVANLTDQHLLVRIPHEGAGVTDLSQVPASELVH
jgi:hypothetical protein